MSTGGDNVGKPLSTAAAVGAELGIGAHGLARKHNNNGSNNMGCTAHNCPIKVTKAESKTKQKLQ